MFLCMLNCTACGSSAVGSTWECVYMYVCVRARVCMCVCECVCVCVCVFAFNAPRRTRSLHFLVLAFPLHNSLPRTHPLCNPEVLVCSTRSATTLTDRCATVRSRGANGKKERARQKVPIAMQVCTLFFLTLFFCSHLLHFQCSL